MRNCCAVMEDDRDRLIRLPTVRWTYRDRARRENQQKRISDSLDTLTDRLTSSVPFVTYAVSSVSKLSSLSACSTTCTPHSWAIAVSLPGGHTTVTSFGLTSMCLKSTGKSELAMLPNPMITTPLLQTACFVHWTCASIFPPDYRALGRASLCGRAAWLQCFGPH